MGRNLEILHGNTGCFLDSPPQNLSEALERITVVYQAALGLAYIHHNFPDKMAHMDFKPQNLFLTLMDGKLVGKVGDLNLHEEGDIATVTPFYLDLEGPLYGRENHGKIPAHQVCDVWALGITLFEVLNGI